MTSSLTLSLNPVRALVLFGVLVAGCVAALPAHAATAQISATPTTISAGQSTQVSWACGSDTTQATLYTDQGSSAVSNTGSASFSPTATYQYRIVCTAYQSATNATVWVYVEEGACYSNWQSTVDGDAVYTVFDETEEVLPSYTLEGEGYDSSNYYQQCIAACLNTSTRRCNLTSDRNPNIGEYGLTFMKCSLASPGTSKQSKPQEVRRNTDGDIVQEKTYFNIAWDQSTGGTCDPLPPPPTVDLKANPTSIASGGTSKLTWTSTNADNCTGSNFSTGGALNNPTTGVNVNPTATRDYTITCVNEAGMAVDTVRVTVGSTPDLTAGAITPTSVTSGTATTISSTIANSGAAGTGASFSVLFQRATTMNGANVTSLGTVTTAALGANANRSVSFSAGATAFPTSGTWYVRACADKRSGGDANGVIVESNESNNCGPWTAVTASPGSNYPNLIAATPAQTTAAPGQSLEITSVIRNSSEISTGRTFTNLFQIDNNADHSAVYATATDGSPILAANGTDNARVTYTFPSSATGTWYVRACADNNASMVGVVTESNESDNCSAWRAITIGDSSSVLSCSVSSSSVASGGQVTFTALPNRLNNYVWEITPNVAGFPKTTVSNNTSATLTGNAYYSMSVTVAGDTATCPLVSVGNPCGTPTPTITANPTRVRPGSTSVLTVSANGVSGTCTLSGPGVSQTLTADQCVVDEVEVTTGAITTQSTYTLTCGSVSTQAIVNVIPSYEVF